MSHKAIVKVTIRNIDREILREAITEVAKELGVEFRENAVVRGYSFREKVDFMFKVKTAYGYGVGVKIVGNNRIDIIADVHSHSDEVFLDKIRDRIIQWYSAIAARETLKEMGYGNVTIKREKEELIVVAEEGFSSW